LSARFLSSDGRTVVDVVKLSLPDGSTSERFRVRRFGIFVGEACTVTELGRIVELADLSEARELGVGIADASESSTGCEQVLSVSVLSRAGSAACTSTRSGSA
jgi:hypothetical protein